jgi:hypothetical protein
MPCTPDITVRKIIPIVRVTEERSEVAVTERRTNVTVQDKRPTVTVRPRKNENTTVHPVTRTLRIAAPGPMGPPGPSADSIPAVPFSYGDASRVVATCPFAGIIRLVRVDFETPFNGASPQVEVGFVGDTDALMTAAENDPSEAASYEVAVDVPVTAGTQIWLGVVGGTSGTQGNGTLFIDLTPEN